MLQERITLVKDFYWEHFKTRTLDLRTSDMSTCLTTSNTKRVTDLGTLVVPFDQTFHPLHLSHAGSEHRI